MDSRAALLSQPDPNTDRCNRAPDIHGQTSGTSDTRAFNSKTRGSGVIHPEERDRAEIYGEWIEAACEVLADATDAPADCNDLAMLANDAADIISRLTVDNRALRREIARLKDRLRDEVLRSNALRREPDFVGATCSICRGSHGPEVRHACE